MVNTGLFFKPLDMEAIFLTNNSNEILCGKIYHPCQAIKFQISIVYIILFVMVLQIFKLLIVKVRLVRAV